MAVLPQSAVSLDLAERVDMLISESIEAMREKAETARAGPLGGGFTK